MSTVDRPFTLQRRLPVPPARAWALLTELEHLRRWFGPQGSVTRQASLDLRPGGTYHYGLEIHGEDLWGLWRFLELDPPRRMALLQSFSNPDGTPDRHAMAPVWPLLTHSTTTLEPDGAGTLLTLTWRPHDATPEEAAAFAEAHADLAQGWNGTFDRLEAYLAGGEG